MRLVSKIFLAGTGALVCASAATAAGQPTNVLRIAMPDGTVQRVRYTGNVPPRIVVIPAARRMAPVAIVRPDFAAQFRMLDRIAADMDRRFILARRQAAAMASQRRMAGGPVTLIRAQGEPPGAIHYSFVSMSNGASICSRTVQITSLGPNQPPKVVSQTSGNCGGQGSQMRRSTVAPSERASPVAVKPGPPRKPAAQEVKVRDTV